MQELQKEFPNTVIGLSDHTTSNLACFGAVALGASILERQKAFRYVILFSSFMVALIGFLVLLFMKSDNTRSSNKINSLYSLTEIKSVLKLPSVWLLMIIIMSAYVGYKLTDIYSLYASDVMLYNQIEAAEVGALQLYLRPIVCVLIGLLADNSKGIFWIICGR